MPKPCTFEAPLAEALEDNRMVRELFRARKSLLGWKTEARAGLPSLWVPMSLRLQHPSHDPVCESLLLDDANRQVPADRLDSERGLHGVSKFAWYSIIWYIESSIHAWILATC